MTEFSIRLIDEQTGEAVTYYPSDMQLYIMHTTLGKAMRSGDRCVDLSFADETDGRTHVWALSPRQTVILYRDLCAYLSRFQTHNAAQNQMSVLA